MKIDNYPCITDADFKALSTQRKNDLYEIKEKLKQGKVVQYFKNFIRIDGKCYNGITRELVEHIDEMTKFRYKVKKINYYD